MSRPSGLYPKPPIGVMPSAIFYERRMVDLINAITRAMEWIQTETQRPHERDFWLIERWAEELKDIAWLQGGKVNG